IIDRRLSPKIAEAQAGSIGTLIVTIERHLPGLSRRHPYRVRCADETGFLHLVYFHARRDYLEKLLPVGSERVVSGRVERFNAEVQIVHPDHVAAPDDLDTIQTVEPVYPLTAGLMPKVLRRAIGGALARAPDLPEWLDLSFIARQGWMSWKAAIEAAHAPADEADLNPLSPARARLAYDELLANQLALAIVRRRQRRLSGRPLQAPGRLRQMAEAALPFALTKSQLEAGEEIRRDMASGDRMLR